MKSRKVTVTLDHTPFPMTLFITRITFAADQFILINHRIYDISGSVLSLTTYMKNDILDVFKRHLSIEKELIKSPGS